MIFCCSVFSLVCFFFDSRCWCVFLMFVYWREDRVVFNVFWEVWSVEVLVDCCFWFLVSCFCNLRSVFFCCWKVVCCFFNCFLVCVKFVCNVWWVFFIDCFLSIFLCFWCFFCSLVLRVFFLVVCFFNWFWVFCSVFFMVVVWLVLSFLVCWSLVCWIWCCFIDWFSVLRWLKVVFVEFNLKVLLNGVSFLFILFWVDWYRVCFFVKFLVVVWVFVWVMFRVCLFFRYFCLVVCRVVVCLLICWLRLVSCIWIVCYFFNCFLSSCKCCFRCGFCFIF